MSSFSVLAPHYEALMEGVPYKMWIAYLKLIWANIDAEPRKLLEVCCGTGKLCRLLAEEGYEMTGVDVSEPMVEVAKSLAHQQSLAIRFEAQDAAGMQLDEQFDAAFSFFDSLNYITEPRRCASAIQRTGEHLRPGAPFLFDLNTAYAFEQDMFTQTNMSASAKVRYEWRSKWDPRNRLCTVKMDFWTDGEAFKETHVQRAHAPEEVLQWMGLAGFARVNMYDAYTLDPPRARSDRIHVLGIKQG